MHKLGPKTQEGRPKAGSCVGGVMNWVADSGVLQGPCVFPNSERFKPQSHSPLAISELLGSGDWG